MMTRAIIIVRLTVAFLTRLPGVHPVGATPADFACAQALFPLVGAGIGAAIAAVQLVALAAGLAPIAAAGLALAAGLLLTGALHEDGLADMADGFGGGRDRETKLVIMRDSRVGSYGALALTSVMIIKAGTLASLRGVTLLVALAIAHGVSRSAVTAMAAMLPPARADGLAAAAGQPRAGVFLTSAGLSMIAGLILLTPTRFGLVVIATIIVVATIAVLARRQVGGQTGDVLGATQQLVETAILLVLSSSLPR